MTEEGFWVAQIVVGAIGLAILLAYTVFTAGLFLKARGQLSELKRTGDLNKEALDLAQAEFRARTRPWLAVEKITSEGETMARWYVVYKNVGFSPALNLQSAYRVYVQEKEVPMQTTTVAKRLAVLPGQTNTYWISFPEQAASAIKNGTAVRMVIRFDYGSSFGEHRTVEEHSWSKDRSAWMIASVEVT